MEDSLNSNSHVHGDSTPLRGANREPWLDSEEGEQLVEALTNAVVAAALDRRMAIHCFEASFAALVDGVIERVRPGLARRRVRAFAVGVRESVFGAKVREATEAPPPAPSGQPRTRSREQGAVVDRRALAALAY